MTSEQKNKKRGKIFEAIPKSLDHKLVQNAVNLLHEVQKQAVDLKEDTNEEIGKLLNKFKESYQDIGSKVTGVSKEAKKQAQVGVEQLVQHWNTSKSQLPEKLTKEMDRLLDRVGLVRKKKSAAKPKAPAAQKTTKAKPATKPAKSKPKVKPSTSPKKEL